MVETVFTWMEQAGTSFGDLLWKLDHDNSGKGIENINGNTELAPPVVTAVGSASGTACPFCHIEVFSMDRTKARSSKGTRRPTQMELELQRAQSRDHTSLLRIPNGSGNTSEFSAPFAVPATPAQPFTNCDAHANSD